MLKYHLRKSHLRGLTDKYLAQVEDVHSYTLDEILNLMGKQEALLNADQARLALATLSKVLKTIVQDGEAVNLPMFKMQPAITGTFDDANTPFSHTTHKVEMNLTLGKELSELLPNVKVQKEDFQPNNPVISEVFDTTTSSKNTNISVNAAVKIEGTRIKIEGTDASNGVYFVAQDGSETKVTAAFIENKPSELIITTPSLTVGNKYTLKIVTQHNGGRPLKTPRTGLFSSTLTAV